MKHFLRVDDVFFLGLIRDGCTDRWYWVTGDGSLLDSSFTLSASNCSLTAAAFQPRHKSKTFYVMICWRLRNESLEFSVTEARRMHCDIFKIQRYELQTMCHRSLLFRRLKFLIQRQSSQLYQVRFRYFLSVAVTEFHFEFFYIAAFLAITVILLDDCLMKRDISEGKEGASNEHTISQNFMANTNDHSLAKMYKQTRKLTLSRFGELRANSTSTLIFFQLHTALRVLMHWDSMIFSFCLRGERKRSGAGVWGGEEKGHPLKSDHQVKSSTRKLKR
uniref:C-type lectin domain-containing protein n=1 Tax=Ascaris lumbricoides TaxID=6252 RepID=A0A0M3IE85_ASCLU